MRNILKQHKIVTTVAAVTICIGIVVAVLLCSNENYIEFSIADNTSMELEYGTQPELPKVTALYKGTIFNKEGTEIEVKVTDETDYDKLGDYRITYSANWKKTTSAITLNVKIKDTQAPEITLVTNPDAFTSPIAQYEEEGFTAIDNYDGDLTTKVVCVEKDGVVTYTVSDSSGNETTVKRTIVYKDAVAPIIKLKGDKTINLLEGQAFQEPGFSAADDCDGDITAKVIVEGAVNTKIAATYKLKYKVADSSGNTYEITRTIKVKKPESKPSSGEKVVYLTFDDGPGAHTEKLLDVLDKYNVKATFFVTGANPKYYHLIGEAHRRGHTIALHTYSHQYSIYSSLETYYADLNKIRDIVVKQTGVEPTMVRFPGGTSNTISENYCKGIMTQLKADLPLKGYQFYDWNVSSGDAGGTTTEQGVFNNVIKGISGRKTSIVLQHDIKKYSVEAVDDIIEWGLANGYTFKAMDENTPVIQQRPNN